MHVSALLFGQPAKKLTLLFSASYAEKPLNQEYYPIANKDSLKIEQLKFYISHLTLIKENKEVWKEEKSFHLIDVFNPSTCAIELTLPKELSFDEIKMNLGIDSIANTSGALGGDLDPTKGMYWTWQSGYINFKLEGISSLCKTRKQEFQFHLGGYQYPYNSLQQLHFEVSKTQQINLGFDVEKFISAVNLSEENQIMTPSTSATKLAQKAASAFIIKE